MEEFVMDIIFLKKKKAQFFKDEKFSDNSMPVFRVKSEQYFL